MAVSLCYTCNITPFHLQFATENLYVAANKVNTVGRG